MSQNLKAILKNKTADQTLSILAEKYPYSQLIQISNQYFNNIETPIVNYLVDDKTALYLIKNNLVDDQLFAQNETVLNINNTFNPIENQETEEEIEEQIASVLNNDEILEEESSEQENGHLLVTNENINSSTEVGSFALDATKGLEKAEEKSLIQENLDVPKSLLGWLSQTK